MTTAPGFHTLARVAPVVAITLLGRTNDARVAALRLRGAFSSGAVPTVSVVVVVVVVEVVVVWTVCHHSGIAPCWSDAGTRCAVLVAFTRFCGSNLFALILTCAFHRTVHTASAVGLAVLHHCRTHLPWRTFWCAVIATLQGVVAKRFGRTAWRYVTITITINVADRIWAA